MFLSNGLSEWLNPWSVKNSAQTFTIVSEDTVGSGHKAYASWLTTEGWNRWRRVNMILG